MTETILIELHTETVRPEWIDYNGQQTRRSAPMPEPVLQRLEKLLEAHRALPAPAQAGRRIDIGRR